MKFNKRLENKKLSEKKINFISNYPILSSGFIHYLHAAKINFEKIKDKEKLYNITDDYNYSSEYILIELLNFYSDNKKLTKKISFNINPPSNILDKLVIDNDNPELMVINHICDNYNKITLEMEIYSELIDNINKAMELKCDIICKIYETFTFNSVRLLSRLINSYEYVYICKPFSSKSYNPEKFIICFNFIKNANYDVTEDVYNNIIKINSELLNMLFISLNKILTYIENKNFYGEEYNKYINNQLKNSVKIPINF